MNLKNFQNNINQIIFDRGYDYYSSGFVSFVEFYDGAYYLHVEGSDVYEVVVTLSDDDEITSSFCNCPYAYGPVCKHEVAAYFELLDLEPDALAEVKAERQGLREVLEQLPQEELVDIVMEMAKGNSILKNRLILQYSKIVTGFETVHFKEIIRSIVNSYGGKGGFITYGEMSRFTKDLGDCLVQAEACENPVIGLRFAFLLLEEAIEAFQYADVSSGDLDQLISDALETIDCIVAGALDLGTAQEQVLFDELLAYCEHEVFEDYDEYRNELLGICMRFAYKKVYREQFIEKINALLIEHPISYSDRYHNQSMNRFLGQLIEQYGTEAEAEQFIQANLHDPSIREKRIEQCMEKKDYEQVIQLALDGEKMDREYRGRVKKWQEKRYMAYKALAWKDEQGALGKMLFMDGDFDYYQDLKALADNPSDFYLRLKQELKEQTSGQALYLFERLIEETQDYVELIEFVRKYPEYIEEHAAALFPIDHALVRQLYEDKIHMEAAEASNRPAYRDVCSTIRRYGKVVGEAAVQEIIDKLKVTYKRKPAFLDELGKV